MTLRFKILIFILAGVLQSLSAQLPFPKPTIEFSRTTDTIKLDGILNEPFWNGAQSLSNFLQFQPQPGAPATVPTRVYVIFGKEALYVGIEALVPEDREPQASLTKRDGDITNQDDSVTLLLDPLGTGTDAYIFAVNALGTQVDGRMTDNRGAQDVTWDGQWQSATWKEKGRWTGEMVIPYKEIQYEAGTAQDWGLNVMRTYPEKLEYSFWNVERDLPFRVSSFGRIRGVLLQKPKGARQAILYGLTEIGQGIRPKYQIGGDLRYNPTPLWFLNGTVNPDFATVEADQEQINLTRYELELREKRPFFLEDAEQFQQRIRTFYSRRIRDIDGGLKFVAKNPGWTATGLYAQGERIPLDPAAPALGEATPNFGVFRFQKNIKKSSTVGLIAADRSFKGRSSGSAGLDLTYYFTDRYSITGQLIQSYGPFSSGTHAFFLRPSYDTSRSHFHIRYTDLGDRFAENANSMGFIQDDNKRELDSALEYRINPGRSQVEQIQILSENNAFWSQAGALRRYRLNPVVDVQFKNKFSLRSSYWEEYILFEKGFFNHRGSLTLGYNTRQWEQSSVSYEVGRNFDDFIQIFTARAAKKISDKISAELEFTRLLRSPGREGPNTSIGVVRTSYYFTKDFFLKIFYQANSSIDRHNVQAALVWRHTPPFGTLQLVYQRGTAGFGERSTQGDTLFGKISVPISF